MSLLRPIVLLCLFTLAAAGCRTISPAPAVATDPRPHIFFVVPTAYPEGGETTEAVAALQTWLLDTAGGYTCLGPVEGAWRAPDGAIHRETNIAYLVTVFDGEPEPLAAAIAARIETDFRQQEAYVVRW
jgi:hypothetical protein